MAKFRIKFEYDINSPKFSSFEAEDFDGFDCDCYDDFLTELREQAPNMEWSVHPDETAALELWKAVKARREEHG